MSIITAVVEGVKDLRRRFKAWKEKQYPDKSPSVVVGYTASYAIYVHENLTASHSVGQAKFLEAPYRRNLKEIVKRVRAQLSAGNTMGQALLVAGLYLQRQSQVMVPVDTGFLRNSAFTRLED